MILTKDLTKRYGDFEALKGVSFAIQQGEIIGLLGPNGAGKTTTLKILSGYLQPTSGTAVIDTFDIAKNPLQVKQRLGYLPETNPLYEDMKVDEYLKFVADLKGLAKDKINSHVEGIIKKTGLVEKTHSLINQLSKGYKQRVGIASALINDPHILILDEPTEGLDPNQRIEIRNLIRDVGRDRTVIFSSHILSEVEAISDRVLIIHQGKVVASGTPQELKTQALAQTKLFILAKVDSFAAKQAFASFDGVRSVVKADAEGELTRIILEVDSNRELRPSILSFMQERNWDVYEIYQQSQSLEDVFVTLTK